MNIANCIFILLKQHFFVLILTEYYYYWYSHSFYVFNISLREFNSLKVFFLFNLKKYTMAD